MKDYKIIIILLERLFKTKDFNIILTRQIYDKNMTFITRLSKKIASKNLCHFNIKIIIFFKNFNNLLNYFLQEFNLSLYNSSKIRIN